MIGEYTARSDSAVFQLIRPVCIAIDATSQELTNDNNNRNVAEAAIAARLTFRRVRLVDMRRNLAGTFAARAVRSVFELNWVRHQILTDSLRQCPVGDVGPAAFLNVPSGTVRFLRLQSPSPLTPTAKRDNATNCSTA